MNEYVYGEPPVTRPVRSPISLAARRVTNRSSWLRVSLILASAALLSGCDVGASLSTQIADQFRTPHQYSNDPLRFDGSYQGNTRLVSATGACPQPRYGVVMIGDNTLTYAYAPGQVFSVPVDPTGKLHGVAGDITLDGQISRDNLTMTISSPTCTSSYATRFILNHS
jgi:hypothetical protein